LGRIGSLAAPPISGRGIIVGSDGVFPCISRGSYPIVDRTTAGKNIGGATEPASSVATDNRKVAAVDGRDGILGTCFALSTL